MIVQKLQPAAFWVFIGALMMVRNHILLQITVFQPRIGSVANDTEMKVSGCFRM